MENQNPQPYGIADESTLDSHPVTASPLTEVTKPSVGLSPRKIRNSSGLIKIAIATLLILLVIGGGFYAFKVNGDRQANKLATQPSDNFGVQNIPLKGLTDPSSLGLNTVQSLSINGQLRVNNSLIFAPTTQPTQATTGQLYYDRDGSGFAFFDGTEFVAVTDANDIAELQSQINALQGSISQTPDLPADIATQSGNNTFTGSNTFESGLEISDLTVSGATILQGGLTVNGVANLSSLSVSGATNLGPTTASSLVLSSPLSVGSGGTGASSFTSNGILLGQGSSALTTVSAAGPGLCLISTGGAPSFQACPGGGGAVVDSLNGLTGPLTLLNASGVGSNITIDDASAVAKGIASFNASNFSVTAGAVNTIQNIAVTSTPTFAGLTLNGNLSIGANSIVTSGATISSAELDVLDSGINELEVTGAITDVTAGNGLTGGAASGNASLDIASANGAITVNADSIALTLQPTGDALSGTTSSGSGLEILTSGLSLLQGCGDGQILKWNETSDTWGCAADAGGSGVGDDVMVTGLNADGANFINTVASGSSAGLTWNLNTTPSPDEISISISNASATEAGVVTTGVQSFSGDKTYNNTVTVTGLFSANGGVTIETGDTFTFNGDALTDLSGTGLVVAGGVLQASLGVAIDSSEITDLTVTGADIANDTITDTQLAFDTGQNLTVISTPTFAGITLNGNLSLGANSIVTSGATISSAELDVLDGGIAELEVTGVITDVTAGGGLTGGAASGNATLNITSANGGIVVNADDIALTLQPTGDALSATTSSGSGFEILTGGLTLLQGCSDGQILKWNETTDVWACGTDSGSGGLGDDVSVGGANATNANFIDTVASGTTAGVVWALNTTPSPDEISLTVSNASGTVAGVVTTGIQSFAGDKTFGNAANVIGLFTATGGVTIETGDTFTFNGDAFTDLTGTGLTISAGVLQSTLGIAIDSSEITDLTVVGGDIANDTITDTQLAFDTGQHLTVSSTPSFAGITLTGNLSLGSNSIVTSGATISSAELDVLDGGILESEVSGVITDVAAGTGLTGGGASGNATLSLDYTSDLASNTLTVNQSSFAATGILFEGSTADAFETLFTLTDPTADNTITLPNASGTICLSTGNCAGAGGGVTTGGGSTNRLAKFTASQAVNDSTITDDGTNVTTSANMIIQGGNVTAGTNSQLGSFILHDGNGQTTTLRAGDSASPLTFILPTGAGSQYQCLKYDTAGQLIWDDCDGGGGGGGGVTTLNSLAGALSIQGNTQIGVNPSTPNINLSINADSIGDGQLVFNTGQHLTTTSAPTFAGLTLSGDLTVGSNNIVTGLTTISSAELDVLDGGVTELEVSGVITDVTSGTGLTGGAASGNATVNIASANGGIVVNADDIALTLQPAGDGLSSTTSSGSGLEILAGGFALLQGCSDGQILKWNETTDTWGCGADAGGSGVGDSISVGGAAATDSNFINTTADSTTAGITWALNTTPTPDEISLTVSAASATLAGIVTNGVQSFGGVKTFSAQIVANGGIDLGANSIVTSGATISAAELNVLDSGIDETEVSGVITSVTAGNGLTGGATAGTASVAVLLQPSTDGVSSTTSSGSGLEVSASGLGLLQGCTNDQILKWNETTDVWACAADAGGSGLGDDVYVNNVAITNGADFFNQTGDGSNATITWGINTSGHDRITLDISEASTSLAGIVNNTTQSFAGDKTFNNALSVQGALTVQGNTIIGSDVADTLSVNAVSTFNENITVAGNKTLRLIGGNTASRPGSPTEGMIYFDTTTKQLLTYANGKWQADRTESVIVAASNSSQADKDAADYVGDGNTGAALDGDQVQINSALTAGSGKKVVLLAGTYTIDAAVTMPNNTTLSGVGSGTVITIPNTFNTSINAITNTDTSTGTAVVIKDLRLDGNTSNQSSGVMRGVFLDNMGNGTGSSARQGSKISNIWSSNWRTNGIAIGGTSANNNISNVVTQGNDTGIVLASGTARTNIADSVMQGNASYGIWVNTSNYNTITGNTAQGNTTNGIYVYIGNYNTVTGNTAAGNDAGIVVQLGATNTVSGNTTEGNTSYGISIVQTSSATVSGNTVANNSNAGIFLTAGSTLNVISNNRVIDNGSSTNNNGIQGSNADANGISGNYITDTSASSSNYAINLNSTSDNNTLSDNTLGTGSINDLGTGTIYGGQVNSSGNYVIQPAGTVELMKNTNVTGTLGVTGSVIATGQGKFGYLTVDTNNPVDDKIELTITAGGAAGFTGTITNADLTAARTWTLPNESGTFCLQSSANCGFALSSGSGNYIQNQTASQQSVANFWISGTGRADTALQAPTFDTATAVALTLGGNATSISVVDDTVLAAGKSLTVTGGNTGSRPASPTEGMVYFDIDTDRLLTYSNGKWQADRTDAVIVAASNSSQSDKDAADYVADGNTGAVNDGDQVQINSALTAGSGKKVVLLAGTYNIDESITVPNNTTLAGVGRGTYIEFADTDLADRAIENSDTSTGTGITLQDFRMDGRKDLNTGGFQYGIWMSGIGGGSGTTTRKGVTINNVIISNFNTHNFFLQSFSNSKVSNSMSFVAGSTGFATNTGGTGNVFEGNLSQGNTDHGFSFNGLTFSTITGNIARSNGDAGFHFHTFTNNNVTGNNSSSNTSRGMYFTNTAANNTITGNSLDTNPTGMQFASVSSGNTVTGNKFTGATGQNINVDSSSLNQNISGNFISGGTHGIALSASSNHTVANNTIMSTTTYGILLQTTTTSIVTGNRIVDSGNTTNNNAIYLDAADGNVITNNTISDASASSTNYAINIFNSTADNNSLSGNTLGTGSINSVGTGTVFGGQVNSSGNYVIQPAGTVELTANTNVTGTLNVTSNVDTNGSLTVGNANQFVISNTGVVTSGTWQGGAIAGVYGGTGQTTTTIGDLLVGAAGNTWNKLAIGGNGTCLLSNGTTAGWGTCTPTNLQGTYNASSPATIDLSNSKDFTINATEQTTDSSIVFNLQCVTCSTDGGRFAIQDAGVDIFRINPNGDIIIGTAANNMTLASSNGYKPVLSGTARNSKKIRLHAEYPSVVLTADGSNNLGTLTSGYDNGSSARMSYYNWTTTEGSNQDYDVVVQVPLPSDFGSWDGANPLSITARTSDTTNGTITLEARDSADAQICNFVSVTPGSTGTWATNNTACTLSSGTYTAGDYITLRIKLQAPNGGSTRVGNITLNYLSRF